MRVAYSQNHMTRVQATSARTGNRNSLVVGIGRFSSWRCLFVEHFEGQARMGPQAFDDAVAEDGRGRPEPTRHLLFRNVAREAGRRLAEHLRSRAVTRIPVARDARAEDVARFRAAMETQVEAALQLRVRTRALS